MAFISFQSDSKLRFWALTSSIAVHVVALTALGTVHFHRRIANVGASSAQVSMQTIQRVIEQPASKPKPVLEPAPIPQPKPAIAAVEPTVVHTPAAAAPVVPPTIEPLPKETAVPMDSNTIFFCGHEAIASRVCYVVDGSGSMNGLMYLVREQLRLSILELSGDQAFSVLFFMKDGVLEQPFDGRLERATPAAKATAMNLLSQVRPEGQTEAEKGIAAAFGLRDRSGRPAEAIYFVTDGFDLMDSNKTAFLRRLDTLRSKLSPDAVVHTIGIRPEPQDSVTLSQLAALCNGNYIEVN